MIFIDSNNDYMHSFSHHDKLAPPYFPHNVLIIIVRRKDQRQRRSITVGRKEERERERKKDRQRERDFKVISCSKCSFFSERERCREAGIGIILGILKESFIQ